MKIYVAAKWEDKVRAHQLMTFLSTCGHHITYDWTGCEQFSAEQASLDKQGVMEADALVLLATTGYILQGALVEFGMALARGIPTYLIGTGADTCIFSVLPEVRREQAFLVDLVLS